MPCSAWRRDDHSIHFSLKENPPMMVLPFLIFFIGLCGILRGQQRIGLGLWALGIAAVLVLFRMHATSTLNIVL
ncbi:probable transmembrane protein [Ralstonia pseudosolanacearum GMI1000]|nr:probable transmembrane protein [Ralstonia pseudosolanacearum GMI1000]